MGKYSFLGELAPLIIVAVYATGPRRLGICNAFSFPMCQKLNHGEVPCASLLSDCYAFYIFEKWLG